jgi:hypothetical protein
MSRVSAIGAELLGLFVDDRGFAVSILLWLAFVFLCLRWLGDSAWMMAGLLFAGLAAILIESARRAGRTRRRG